MHNLLMLKTPVCVPSMLPPPDMDERVRVYANVYGVYGTLNKNVSAGG